MKKMLLVLAVLFVAIAQPAQAAEPRFKGSEETKIKRPEVSQSYYAELKGQPDQYTITSNENFDLSVTLSIPAKSETKNIIVWVRKRNANGPGFIIDGQYAKWKETIDPFDKSDCLKTPIRELKNTAAGTYDITVFNSDNSGKYILTVGNRSGFPLIDQIENIIVMPKIKAFYGISTLQSYSNLAGIYLLLGLYIIVMVIIMIKRQKKAKKNGFKESSKIGEASEQKV